MKNNANTLLMDIGGTHIRLGIQEGLSQTSFNLIQPVSEMRVSDFPDLTSAIERYLGDYPSINIEQFSISVACPVRSRKIKLTNHSWQIDVDVLAEHFNLERIKIINDFTALALSLPFLSDEDVTQLGGMESEPNAPICLLGAGTGLGVSGLHKTKDDWWPIEGEGGHVTIGARNARELRLFEVLQSRFEHVSAERLLSGSGIEETYQILCELDKITPQVFKAWEVAQNWKDESCPVCMEVMALFCDWPPVIFSFMQA